MPLSNNVLHQLDELLDQGEGGLTGDLVLNCKHGLVVKIRLLRDINTVPDDREVVDLTEARRRGKVARIKVT